MGYAGSKKSSTWFCTKMTYRMFALKEYFSRNFQHMIFFPADGLSRVLIHVSHPWLRLASRTTSMSHSQAKTLKYILTCFVAKSPGLSSSDTFPEGGHDVEQCPYCKGKFQRSLPLVNGETQLQRHIKVFHKQFAS